MHFVKSALNVRFDGFCVLTTDLLGLSVVGATTLRLMCVLRITHAVRGEEARRVPRDFGAVRCALCGAYILHGGANARSRRENPIPAAVAPEVLV